MARRKNVNDDDDNKDKHSRHPSSIASSSSNSKRFYKEVDERLGTLTIHNTRYKDAGVYACRAGPRAKATTRLRVHSMREAHMHHKYREKLIKKMEKENRHFKLTQREIDVTDASHRLAADAAIDDDDELLGKLIEEEDGEQRKDVNEAKSSSGRKMAAAAASIPKNHPLYGQLQMTDGRTDRHMDGVGKNSLEQLPSLSSSSISSSSLPMVIWVPGEWSQCSLRCGGLGMRVRKVTCEEKFDTHFRVVPDSVCEQNPR